LSSELKASPWTSFVVAAALLKAVVALLAALSLPIPSNPAFPKALYFFCLTAFGVGGALLLLYGREDRRAIALAGFFAAFAAPYTITPINTLQGAVTADMTGLVASLQALRPDTFLAYFLWRFVRDFPDVPQSARMRRWVRRGLTASGWAGGGLFLFGLGMAYTGRLPSTSLVRKLFERFDPKGELGLLWGILTPLIILALAALARKARGAVAAEQRRARFFTLTFCALLGPIFILLMLILFYRPVKDFTHTHEHVFSLILWPIVIPACLAPVATAYAATVHQVLDLKLIARSALQYTLARYMTIVLAAAPLAALACFVFLNQEKTVAELFHGPAALLLLACTLLGIAALRYRSRLLEAIDRRYFREQYDARQILSYMVQRIRGTHEPGEMAELLCRGIDQALHLETIGLLVEDRRSGSLVDPRSRARRLDAASPLAQFVASASEPLAVDLDKPRSTVAGLPESDRHWLLDSGFRLLVPIVARDGSLLGMIGLGEKKSGLPFLREDRKFLSEIAGSAALVLELEIVHSSHPSTPRRPRGPELPPAEPDELGVEQAKECPISTCGLLYRSHFVFCGKCSHRLETAPVPYVLPGKFRFERRIGSGGMGVVYRAVDLALGRSIAVKTLRHVSPEDAMRLRREARTAASVSHPHLASIYGVETWQGTPMLILEFLEGGTLTQRTEKGPLEPRAVVELGIAMTGALERLHAADILHRDIKPSNIGFTRDGVPKLMDFGIARVMWDRRREAPGSSYDGDDSQLSPTLLDDLPTSGTAPNQLVGTLSYLSPEALAGQAPGASFDLWSLCLVLYECLIGRKLFVGANQKQVIARIQMGRIPDLEQALPGTHPAVAQLFRTALHRQPARRPASARELKARLEEVRAQLNGKTD
jgi:protein kinase-like protein/GAF domain-containing protein